MIKVRRLHWNRLRLKFPVYNMSYEFCGFLCKARATVAPMPMSMLREAKIIKGLDQFLNKAIEKALSKNAEAWSGENLIENVFPKNNQTRNEVDESWM